MNDPLDLVRHVNRSKSGMTKMQVQLSIEMRAGMNEASKRLGMSQLSIIRAAISAFLQAHGATVGGDILADSRNMRESRPGVAPVADPGAIRPEFVTEPEPEPVPVTEPEPEPVTEPEPIPTPEPDQSSEPVPDPGQTPAPKRPRGKKGSQS